MTSRRAVSPVIATVILIAVAVALGIAVAVWAGALTGGLQKQEKLIINSYKNAAGNLVISITNQSPGSTTLTQVLFNQQPVANGAWSLNAGAFSSSLPQSFASGSTNTLAVTPATLPTTPASGITYPITVVTAAGNSYPSVVTWP